MDVPLKIGTGEFKMNTTPIEFMAWDKKANEMVYWKDISRTNILGMLANNHNRNNSRGELMQRTALRSINDEPIYNHMIVKTVYGGQYFLIDMFNYKLMASLSTLQLKIVGNRFQHHELLKLCK